MKNDSRLIGPILFSTSASGAAVGIPNIVRRWALAQEVAARVFLNARETPCKKFLILYRLTTTGCSFTTVLVTVQVFPRFKLPRLSPDMIASGSRIRLPSVNPFHLATIDCVYLPFLNACVGSAFPKNLFQEFSYPY